MTATADHRSETPPAPGRLGDPEMSLGTDPRTDPRMLEAMRPMGMDQLAPPPPIGPDAPRGEILELMTEVEQLNVAGFDLLVGGMAPVAGVERSVEEIDGPDGGRITLYLHRPAGASGPLPGVVHIHGGGMTILAAADEAYARLRDELAATGMVVVGVEFRNAGGRLGAHPYPAGLDDCAGAVRWADAHRGELGVDRLVVSGESGGGNLTLAVTHRARREGWLEAIDGVYAMCPYISGAWADPPADLPSLRENDRYFIDCAGMAVMARAYDPDGSHATDRECWPLAATVGDLAGMPPHVISVNELDPLRDEGLAYHRRLAQAGVAATARSVPGTCHAGDLIFAASIPDTHAATLRDVKAFVDSL